MGTDLTLMPIDQMDFTRGAIAWTMLELDRRSVLWGRIGELDRSVIGSAGFKGFRADLGGNMEGFGTMMSDAYGNPLMWAKAGDLARCLAEVNDSEDIPPPENVAAAAYLAALSPRWPVVLYWH